MRKNIIKKIFAFIIIVSVLICVFATSSFADGPSRDEITEILEFGFQLRYTLADRFAWYEGGFDYDPKLLISGENGKYPSLSSKKVKDGYSYEEVLLKITRTIDGELAKKAAERFEALKDSYCAKDGAAYYLWMTPDRTNRFDINTSVKDYKMESLSTDSMTVSFPVKVSRNHEAAAQTATAYVTLNKTGDNWKISGYDISELVLSVDNSGLSGETIDKDGVVSCVKAIVCDIYAASSGRGYVNSALLSEGMLSGQSPECLSDPEVWREYARKFCTENVTNYLLPFDVGGGLYLADGKVLYKANKTDTSLGDGMQTFVLSQQNTDWVLSFEANAAEAKAVYGFLLGKDGSCAVEVNFHFAKTADGWRVDSTDVVEKLNSAFPISEKNRDTSDFGVKNEIVVGVAAVIVLALAAIVKKRSELI